VSAVLLTALGAGIVAAALSAVLGYFVVLRGTAFAGHAVTDIGLTGGSGALLLHVTSLWGVLAFAAGAAVGIDALGTRARERDVATGVVLALALGVGALFLHIGTNGGNGPTSLLFGSVFALDPATLGLVAAIGAVSLGATLALFRPLLFASVAPESAALAGVPVRAVGLAFLLAMAIAVGVTSQIVGVLVSTALLIGPAASAGALVRRPLATLGLAVSIGALETTLGIALAYASYAWPPGGKGWPVSFFVSTLALVGYLVARAAGDRRDSGAGRARA